MQVGRPPPVDQEVVSLCFDGLRLRKERLKRLGIVGTLLGQPSRKGEEHLLAIAVQGRQTVDQFLTRWLEESAKPRLRPRTFECCRMIVSRHLISGLGRIPLSKLSPHDVQPYMNRKSAAGLSARTVQYHRAVLRRALNQALLWGLIPRNVAPW